MRRPDAAIAAAVVTLLVYAFTLAPDVTFWDAGEFIAASHSLGIPHPPGTPLYILIVNVWAKLLFFLPYAVATNLFSAVATAGAAWITATLVRRATASDSMAFASAIAAGAMSTVWLNATETEVYAASLALAMLVLWCAERAGRESHERWTYLTAYLIVLSVPLHLSALVAAPAAIVLAAHRGGRDGLDRRRAFVLGGAVLFAMGVGRMSWWMAASGAAVMLAAGPRRGAPALSVVVLAISALAFLYLRAPFDPAINQGNPDSLASLADVVARRQYDVSPLWPRKAPLWVQLGNVGQYADWQVALSLGPTVLPSALRTLFTLLFLALGYLGAVEHRRTDRRTWLGMLTLFLCGGLGVMAYLNLHAGPSIGYGILPASAAREARERDYFFVFAFWTWGLWSGVGAVAAARRMARPAWTGALIACLPIVLNWRAVSRRAEPERSLPLALAESFLMSAPRDAVLFVAGDNDSYPLWYAQQVHQTRPDVSIITIPLLPTQWYRRQIATRYGVLDDGDVEVFRGKLETAAAIASSARRRGRPIAAANTLTPHERDALGEDWTAAGMVFVEGQHAQVDTATTRQLADWIDRRVGTRVPRDAIDPVASYFRRALNCPRQIEKLGRSGDSTRLDSACNYR